VINLGTIRAMDRIASVANFRNGSEGAAPMTRFMQDPNGSFSELSHGRYGVVGQSSHSNSAHHRHKNHRTRHSTHSHPKREPALYTSNEEQGERRSNDQHTAFHPRVSHTEDVNDNLAPRFQGMSLQIPQQRESHRSNKLGKNKVEKSRSRSNSFVRQRSGSNRNQ